MSITVLDLALHRGAEEGDNGSITMGEVEKTGLPFFGGCQCCGASIACYNAYPSKSGYLKCGSCIDDNSGFETVEEANKEMFK